MKPVKPLFLKTYGKHRRQMSAWISSGDRRRGFDSSGSPDGAIFEPLKPQGTRPGRPAKRKATKKSCDQQNNTTSSRAARPAKKKAKLCLKERSSDEENIRSPSPPPPELTQQSKTTRKSCLVSAPRVLTRRKGVQVAVTSESEVEGSPPKRHKNSVKMKTANVHPPSASRFVTRRRRAAAARPKLPKAIVSILSSSDDFASGAFSYSGNHQPSRRKRVPPALVSSAENSVNAAGTSSFAINPFRELSLNELADHSVGPCPKRPIFCSTPSAGSLSKHGHLKPFPINGQCSTPPSMSVSSIAALSTFQGGLASPEQPVPPPRSTSPIGLHFEEDLQKEPGLCHHEDPSVDLSMEPKRGSCSDEAKSHSEDSKAKNDEELPSLNLFSTDSGSSSHFVSAAGGLEWLIEALKEVCLTKRCTVQLERLGYLTVTQPCSQTTFSSCLEHPGSTHSQPSNEQPWCADSGNTVDLSQSSEASLNLHLSLTSDKTSHCSQSVNSLEQAASVTDSHSTEASVEQSESVLYVESSHHTHSSFEIIMDTQLPASSITAEEATAVEDKCFSKKCSVQINKLALSQLTVRQLKGFTLEEEAGLACHERSVNQEANKHDNDHTHNTDDPEDIRCSGESTERTMPSVRQSKNSSCPAAKTQSTEPETEGKAAVLKEECLTYQPTVEIKRVSLSQLKDATPKSPTYVSNSASDGEAKTVRLSESDSNHCGEDASSMKVHVKNKGSTCPESEITAPQRKKLSLATKEKKRRSTSTDRPGTSRKACVSGMSVSRWKTKGNARSKAVDCSINELVSTQHKQPGQPLGTTMNFFTPVRTSQLNISSLLADLTPNTHTWSRLKAALSVHRKVLLTPTSLHLYASSSPGRMELADVSQDLYATPSRPSLSKSRRSQLLSQHSLVECEDADLSDAEKVYAECGQQCPLPWEECIFPQRMKKCVKIGEGTFGEVFSTTNASGDTVALKIIPVEGSEKVNGEGQKTFGEILHEIIISKELSRLKDQEQNQTHGFIGLNDLHCVQGFYPPDFLKAWDKFDQRKGSENDRPDFFEKDQLFLILEFEFGGVDLENSNGTLASLGVAKSILHQVTVALAVAEQELHFEHRDLHWGNVLVKTTKQKTGSFLLSGRARSLETKGVLVRIIDYSLSRLEIDDLTVSCDISNDEELFMGQGDYQFDIYRLMRQENGNNWSDYHPHTNVLWLHYLCSKLLSMKYRSSGGRGAKDIRAELTRFYDNVLQYSSATETLQNCPMLQ